MKINNEVAPYILSKSSEDAKNKLYLKTFDVSLIANIKGEKPIYKFGFIESQEAYSKRLEIWEEHEKNVIFDGWQCNDLGLFQILTNKYDNTQIEITQYSGYVVKPMKDKKIEYRHTLPERVDDFITDCRRLSIKLFWKENIMNEHGDTITCDKDDRVVDFYRIINDMTKD